MSSRVRSRGAANSLDAATTGVNERILKDCHSLYTDPERGLIDAADSLGLKLLAPRKKISIMLIGNHSAGKSSFINWYIEEHVQRTGVAIETQGFTFVTSGRRRESLTGNATLHLYPHFKPLLDFPGVVDYLSTEISTSKQKRFPLVTFVDTPGLVDGDMNYPFDVNQAILWLGDLVDLIFVFFDPIGQALCKRTLNVVESLSAKHSERMRFYLSKADEAGHESDRQRVMMQIVQELCKRPTLNRTGFDMPTIFIPNPDKDIRCVNQIEDVCRDVEKTINQTIQNTLNQLEKDCDHIGALVDEAVDKDNKARSHNLKANFKGLLLSFFGLTLPFALTLNILASLLPKEFLRDTLGQNGADALQVYLVLHVMDHWTNRRTDFVAVNPTGCSSVPLVTKEQVAMYNFSKAPVHSFWQNVPEGYHFYGLVVLVSLSLLFLMLAQWVSRKRPTMTRRCKKELEEKQQFVTTVVKAKKQSLYKEYLQQTVSEHDL